MTVLSRDGGARAGEARPRPAEPIVDWLPHSWSAWQSHDLIAGVTVRAVPILESMAYASIAVAGMAVALSTLLTC